MAENKAQHFVPKFLLKKFSNNLDQASIGFYNLENNASHRKASIRKQASKPYFYGKDLIFEKALGEFEGVYSKLIEKIIREQTISPYIASILCRFFVIQRNRTTSAVEELEVLCDGLSGIIADRVGEDSNHVNLNIINKDILASLSTSLGLQQYLYIMNLKRYLIHNKTKIPFVIGDSPVVQTNYFMNFRGDNRANGLAKAGFQTLMPVTPEYAILMQDGNVYTLPNDRGCVVLNKEADVRKLNNIQAMNCDQNIYFNQNMSDSEIEIIKENYSSYRKPKSEFNRFGPVKDEKEKRYKEVFEYKGKNYPMHIRISGMKIKNKPEFYDDGSLGAPLRDYYWCLLVRDLQDSGVNLYSEDIWQTIIQHPYFNQIGNWFQMDMRKMGKGNLFPSR